MNSLNLHWIEWNCIRVFIFYFYEWFTLKSISRMRPNESLWMWQGHFLISLVSVAMNVSNPVQFKSNVHIEQTDRFASLLAQTSRYERRHVLMFRLMTAHGLWKDAMHSSRAVKLCVTVRSKPPSKTLFSSMKRKDAKRSL